MWLMLEGDAEILVRCPPCPPPRTLQMHSHTSGFSFFFETNAGGKKRESLRVKIWSF